MRNERRVAALLLVAFGAAGVVLGGRVRTTAGAPPGPPGPVPAASVDLRVPATLSLVKALVRISVTCSLPMKPGMSTAAVVRLANDGRLSDPEATLYACALGAPAGATCSDIRNCAGASGPGSGRPSCDGSVLRTTSAGSPKRPLAISCGAFGESCFQHELGAFCGGEPCSAGETYSCDGAALVACVSGIRVRTPCGLGMTCGRTTGNKILDCVGAAKASCGAERCEGDSAISCIRDSFGGGTERAIACGSLGLECKVATDGGTTAARCVPPSQPGKDGCSSDVSPGCVDGKVTVCAGSIRYSFSCSELGQKGACSTADGTVVCN